MSHKPPLPDAATSPYPIHPAPIEHGADDVTPSASDKTPDDEPSGRLSALNLGIAAAGAAIGSAAIAAALVFYNRPGIPPKRNAAKSGAKTAAAKRATKPKAPTTTTRKSRSAAAKPAAKPAAAAKSAVKAAKPTAAAKPAAKPRARKPKTATSD